MRDDLVCSVELQFGSHEAALTGIRQLEDSALTVRDAKAIGDVLTSQVVIDSEDLALAVEGLLDHHFAKLNAIVKSIEF